MHFRLFVFSNCHSRCTEGTVYTGCADGRIVAISPSLKLSVVARTGQADSLCGTYEFEPQCGRPKGMKFGPDGYLYVVDAYKGLLRVDVEGSTVDTLVSSEQGKGSESRE